MKPEINSDESFQKMAKYLADEMDETEISNFSRNLDESESFGKLFKLVKSDWDKMENLKNTEEIFDTNKAWNNLYDKFERNGLIAQNQSKTIPFRNILKIAAIFILGVAFTSLYYYFFYNNQKEGLQMVDNYGSKNIKQIKLSDGSMVYLNADSKLYFPVEFKGDTRTVEFEGDAFFEITKNPSKPFIIRAKKAEIRVLGTSFNINTNSETNDVEVLVESGKVQLSVVNGNTKPIYLEPGQIGKLKNQNLLQDYNKDKNYLSWKTRKFNFENLNLGATIEILNRAFHANIRCEASLNSKYLFYGTFNPQDSLNYILNILCDQYDLKYEVKSDEIIILPQ
ncbi:MAG: FecR family protein [Bacteroidales bacterium]